MLSADWSDGVRWDPIGSDGVPMGSDWVISHTDAPVLLLWKTVLFIDTAVVHLCLFTLMSLSLLVCKYTLLHCSYTLAGNKNFVITESSTDPPAIQPADLVGDAFGKRRPVGWCGEGSVIAGTTGCGWVHNYLIIDGKGERDDEIKGCS